MKAFFKKNGKFILFFTLIGLVGGYFVGLYLLDSYPPEIRQQAVEQGITDVTMGLMSAVQSAVYGLVLGSLGIFFAGKIGLWTDDHSLTKKPMIASSVVAVIGGIAMILPDILLFGRYSQPLMETYAQKPTVPYIIATVTYGAVIEEVMMRLFLMSLIAFLLYKIFGRKKTEVSTWMLVVANVTAAFLFAVGHLPVNSRLFGLSPLIVIRCMLLNGVFGLAFGWLYRKYGLRYAMIAHGGCHIISKLIWVIFL